MQNKILTILLFTLFIFSTGCVQENQKNPPQYFLNANEENISRLLVNIGTNEELWNALAKEKIPEKVGYRPLTEKVWIMAEIDSVNETWIAIDVQQKTIIHESENKSYFSGIFFDDYDAYQKEMQIKNYTPSTFTPSRRTMIISETTSTTNFTIPITSKQNEIPGFDINSIFLEALFGFILGAISIYFIGEDIPGILGIILLMFVLLGAVLAMINQPSTDISTRSLELSIFIMTWMIECAKMSLGAAFGALFGLMLKTVKGIF